MAKEEIYVGLEIGTTKVCVVVAESRRDGSIRVLGIGESPSRGVRKGEIVDLEAAQKAVKDALATAEEKCDVLIRSVYASITGDHIESFNHTGAHSLPEDREEIGEEELKEVRRLAREVSLPPKNVVLHTILRDYQVDGKQGVTNPVGMIGHKLEADFHIIYGVRTRIQNTIRCIREIPLEVEDIVFSPLASAQAVLTTQQKSLGALVIDFGGGSCDYVLYLDGVVAKSGSLAIGGDHLTNDIAVGLRITLNQAERVKIQDASALLGNALPGETLFVKDETGLAGREIERETLNTIAHLRVQETFTLIKNRLEKETSLDYAASGVFLTGGASQLPGLDHVASEVFGLPVHLAHPHKMTGVNSAFDNPRYSTALGLVKYAQATHAEAPGPSLIKRFTDYFANLFGG